MRSAARSLSHPAVAVGSALALLIGLAALAGVTSSAFRSEASNPGNNIGAASDWVGPSASRSVIGKTQGGTAGYVHSGGTYHVYAEVTDSGNPASGVASVEANAGIIVALSAGSFSFGGLSYNYRSAQQTLASTPEGTYPYEIDAIDNAGNSRTTTGFTVTVDNTVPTAATVQTANGGVAGQVATGDSITYTFSEPPEPNSILAGWSGVATNVVARVNNSSSTGGDNVTIFNAANSSQLPFGTVRLNRTDYVGGNRTYGATGTASTMTMSGNTITVLFGTQSGTGTFGTGTGTMTWLPSATATDRAANPMSTAAGTETGAADREF